MLRSLALGGVCLIIVQGGIDSSVYVLGRSEPLDQTALLCALRCMGIEALPHAELVVARIDLLADLRPAVVYQERLLLCLTFVIGQLVRIAAVDLNRFVQATARALAIVHLIVVDRARIRRAEHVGVLCVHKRSDRCTAGVSGRLPCLLGELGILAV